MTFAKRLPLVALVTGWLGLFAAATLALGHLLEVPIPCGKSSGCASVAAHPSSSLFGIPIAYYGLVAYVALILLAADLHKRSFRQLFAATATTGAGLSWALLAYAHFGIGATCWWCVASGGCMTMLGILALAILRIGPAALPVGGRMQFVLAALGSLAIGLQAATLERAAMAPPVAAATLAGYSADQLVDPRKTLGPADAPVTVVVFSDFWCPMCRTMSHILLDFQRRHPTGVRIAYRHLPFEHLAGHASSGVGAAIAEIAAESGRFFEFSDRLHGIHKALDRDAWSQLLDRFGLPVAEVETRIANPQDPAVRRVQDDCDLAERLGIEATPTFLVMIEGRPTESCTIRGLYRLIRAPAVQAMLAPHKRTVEPQQAPR